MSAISEPGAYVSVMGFEGERTHSSEVTVSHHPESPVTHSVTRYVTQNGMWEAMHDGFPSQTRVHSATLVDALAELARLPESAPGTASGELSIYVRDAAGGHHSWFAQAGQKVPDALRALEHLVHAR